MQAPVDLVPSNQRDLRLDVCLTDQESKCPDSLADRHEVALDLSTGGVAARFAPPTLTLSPERPRDAVLLVPSGPRAC